MMHNRKFIHEILAVLSLLFLSQQSALAANDNDLLLLTTAFIGNPARTHLLQANMAGATQLYTLNAAVKSAAVKSSDPTVFHYRLLGKTTTKEATAGASNLVQVTTNGASGLALTATTGSLMVLYTVTDPTAAYAYVALDSGDPDTLALIKRLNSGLVRVNLANNDVEIVAPGCVVAPIPSNYYTTIQGGDKPIQFDDSGNVVFNGYALDQGTISTKSGLKRVALPSRTVTALTDDSQTVQFFLTLPGGDVVFEAANSLDVTQLWLWKASAGIIDLTNGAVSFLLKDSSRDFVFQESAASPARVTFARSKDGGGVETVRLPKATANAVVGDDGNFYGVDSDTAGHVLVSSILPYQTAPFRTVSLDASTLFPWTTTPPQISKGALYFMARVNPGDGYGSRDTINAQRLDATDTITILGDRRFQLYAWRQTGGYDKLYFTARDKAAASATIYSGVIDTVALQNGESESRYLTLRQVASAVGSAAEVKDMEILTPQAPTVDPGYAPVIGRYAKSDYAEGIVFSKYMNKSTVETNLQLTADDGTAIAFLPVWFLQSLYLIPDRDGLLNTTTTPLAADTCYTLRVPATAKDLWNWQLSASQNPLSTHSGLACLADNLVLYYTFDNQDATDRTTFANNGELNNVIFVDGVQGKAAKFKGTGDPGFIRTPNSASLQFNNAFTVSYYMRLDDPTGMNGYAQAVPGGGQTVFAKSSDRTGVVNSVSLASTTDQAGEWVSINWWGSGTQFDFGVSNTPMAYQNWVYVTLVFDQGLKIYYNGTLFGQKDGTIDLASTNTRDLYLGRFDSTWYPFNGCLDEFRIYNTALTAEEVQQLYTATAAAATN